MDKDILTVLYPSTRLDITRVHVWVHVWHRRVACFFCTLSGLFSMAVFFQQVGYGWLTMLPCGISGGKLHCASVASLFDGTHTVELPVWTEHRQGNSSYISPA